MVKIYITVSISRLLVFHLQNVLFGKLEQAEDSTLEKSF